MKLREIALTDDEGVYEEVEEFHVVLAFPGRSKKVVLTMKQTLETDLVKI